jgi:hypothetical protein
MSLLKPPRVLWLVGALLVIAAGIAAWQLTDWGGSLAVSALALAVTLYKSAAGPALRAAGHIDELGNALVRVSNHGLASTELHEPTIWAHANEGSGRVNPDWSSGPDKASLQSRGERIWTYKLERSGPIYGRPAQSPSNASVELKSGIQFEARTSHARLVAGRGLVRAKLEETEPGAFLADVIKASKQPHRKADDGSQAMPTDDG